MAERRKRGRPPKLNEEGWARLVLYYYDGHDLRECAKKFQVSYARVAQFFHEHPEYKMKRKQPSLPNPQEEPQKSVTEAPPVSKRKIVALKEYEIHG